MPFADGTEFAGYKIVRQLGAGGMGEVYLAQHPRLPRQDALKVLRSDISSDTDYQVRFTREADLAAKLWHPHIVGIHDRGIDDDHLWISMDFVDGTDVSRLLRDRYPHGMPADAAIEIVKAIASALDYAHGRGLLHRDVKPANILITDIDHPERRILLADFGVAREFGDSGAASLTATNMTVGTAAYAAPEQLAGRPVDGRADQYALAATAFHLLAGAPPFNDSNQAVVIGKHLTAPPPPLSSVRPDLAALDAPMARALAKDPGQRFQTCMDFARALEHPAAQRTEPIAAERYSRPNTVQATPPTIPVAPAPAPRRRGRIIAMALGGVAILVLAALATYFVVKPDGEKRPTTGSFALSGTVHLTGDAVSTDNPPSGFECVGAGEFADVGPKTPITVENQAGTLLAKGAFDGSTADSGGCDLTFKVRDVPTGDKFYRVKVGRHDESSYTEAEAKRRVTLDLGAQQTPTSSETAPPADPEQTSLAKLQNLANEDRPDVTSSLADQWIPQISSKRVGLFAEGTTWNNENILAEHMRLRSTYPDVKLLWSGDWSTFDGNDFWVTVVGLPSANPNDALAWCTQKGFDKDHCVAKLVSTTHPIAGSTEFNK